MGRQRGHECACPALMQHRGAHNLRADGADESWALECTAQVTAKAEHVWQGQKAGTYHADWGRDASLLLHEVCIRV